MTGTHMKKNGKKSIDVSVDEDLPTMEAVDSDDNEEGDDSVYDSEDGIEDKDSVDDSTSVAEDEEEVYFEDQGSSDDDDNDDHRIQGNEADDDDDDDDDLEVRYENEAQTTTLGGKKRDIVKDEAKVSDWVHTDDLSSDDEDVEGNINRIGRVPLHWYDEYEHVGYNVHGSKVSKSASSGGDRIDQALAHQDNFQKGKFVVRDALNDRNIELSTRQIELIRRVQSGAYAHPEHDGNPEYVDYFSGVDPEISGLGSNVDPPKSRFQPSRWEKLQVQRLLEKLEKGTISLDYLKGKIRNTNDSKQKDDTDQPYSLWTGDEEDLLNMRKGPQHIAPPKMPPPGHAASYRPPDEYLPTEEELEQWKEMPLHERPHGHMIPKTFPNLRSVGAYEHSVREAFERSLDLYLGKLFACISVSFDELLFLIS